MSARLKDPSRTGADLRLQDAAAFVQAARYGLEDAVILTAGWSRRRLLDVCLTLAVATNAAPVYQFPSR